MKRIAIVAALALALTGCTKHSAKAFVLSNLKDPDSAKFGDFYYNSKSRRACFMVNAKNSMGGYDGFQAVELSKEKDGWHWMDQVDESLDDCRSGFADQDVPEPDGTASLDSTNRDAARLSGEAGHASAPATAADLDKASEAAFDQADNAH